MVKVDAGKCVGCGACAVTCPECFEMKAGKAVVKSSDGDCAKEAAVGCPVGAISA